MFTPYDWQEGIGNRAQYIEAKLSQGAPVLAVSLADGILVFTFRRQARKIYEIYDRLVFGAVGQQSDIEAMRNGALEFATREGFNRSEEDVTIQRVVTAMSAPLKRAFADFSAVPVVARSIFAEVAATLEEDLFYVLDYDGDYAVSRKRAVVAGTLDAGARVESQLDGFAASDVTTAIEQLKSLWLDAANPEEHRTPEELLAGMSPEAVLLERVDVRDNRFRVILGGDV